ncbi:hypothetical protein [uncultured Methylibium sp.]|uniref:hypothetical protein n=1 Tax=uncultured Methylibium sp. TaxID=381093 RepID=UPI0025EAB5A2|nr:hypothetical protein [uncultured Methylibium sp.]
MTPAEAKLVGRLLHAQSVAKAVTIVVLDSGAECRVYEVASGQDMHAEFEHFTTSPAPRGEAKYAEFVYANEVVRIIDQGTGKVLFAV